MAQTPDDDLTVGVTTASSIKQGEVVLHFLLPRALDEHPMNICWIKQNSLVTFYCKVLPLARSTQMEEGLTLALKDSCSVYVQGSTPSGAQLEATRPPRRKLHAWSTGSISRSWEIGVRRAGQAASRASKCMERKTQKEAEWAASPCLVVLGILDAPQNPKVRITTPAVCV